MHNFLFVYKFENYSYTEMLYEKWKHRWSTRHKQFMLFLNKKNTSDEKKGEVVKN